MAPSFQAKPLVSVEFEPDDLPEWL